jgi:signal transduction histidine kinase
VSKPLLPTHGEPAGSVPSLTSRSQRIAAFCRSIRFRLMLWSVMVLAVVLALFCAFVYTRQAQDLRTSALNRLALRTDQCLDLLRAEPVTSAVQDLLPLADRTASGTAILGEDEVLAVIGLQGQVIQDLGPLAPADVASLAASGSTLSVGSGFRSVQLDRAFSGDDGALRDYLFVVTPVPVHDSVAGWLLLGRPLDAESQLPRLLVTLLVASMGTLLVAAGGGYWLAGRAMSPVQTITRAARDISETDLSRRLNLHTGDELGELAGTFDQMLDRLQAAFDRQRQFTADASHELRTPLSIVSLEVSRALEARRSLQEYERVLGVVQLESTFMARLVNQLLTLARLEAGRAASKLEELDFSDVALEAVERLAPLAASRQVKLVTGELPELKVYGDRQQVLQMVTNLVENAVKYAQVEAPRVEVSTGRQDGQAWVRVEDNGPGIAAEHLPHLFERFYRVDKARSRGPEAAGDEAGESTGSGLGLAIVQWIAQAHGGRATVRSQVGQGATFEVNLPLAP